MQIRAVVGARVSHVQGSEKTSHLDQNNTCVTHAERQGWEIVGSFEDLDVSAITTSPWERPDLAPWLTDRAYEWDALLFAKTDRIFRSARDAVHLATWCKENKKIFVLVEDGITLDYQSPDQDGFSQMLAEIFLLMAAMFAEIEGRRFQQRAQGRVRYLRTTDRWPFGAPPYSHQIVPHPSGTGKALDLWPESQEVLHRIARSLLAGDSITAVTAALNEEGVLNPTDAIRARTGKKKDKKRGKWFSSTIKGLMTNPSTQGIKVSNGKPILDSEGRAIRVGPPSFDNNTWQQIQIEIAKRSYSARKRRNSGNPLLGVGKCGGCGANLTFSTSIPKSGKRYTYYVCANSANRCKGVSMKTSEAEEIVETTFLDECGDLGVRERIFDPGEDHGQEIEEVLGTIASLREDRQLGLFSGADDEELYRRQMTALIARRDELNAKPFRRAGWVMKETGDTYRAIWPDASLEEKRKMLQDAGVSFTLNSATNWSVYVDREKLEENYAI